MERTPRYNLIKVLASIQAGTQHQNLGDLDFLTDQLFPDTATGEYLRAHWSDRVPALYASAAVGTVIQTGVAGAALPSGLIYQSANGKRYYTAKTYTIGEEGTVEVYVTAEEAGSAKRYHNLIGYTFGTGFGIGTVIDGRLNRGDNSCVETFCLKHPDMPDIIVEDGVAVRAIKRVYGDLSGNKDHGLEPKEIGAIAKGEAPGNKEAAIKAFDKMGEVAGDAIATAVTLIDGLVVIGGGIMNNHEFLMPGILRSMRGKMHQLTGEELNRVQMKVYNLDNPSEFVDFARGEARKLKVYGSDKEVVYDPQKRIGVMRSKIGASMAISLGAYAFALSELDKQ